MSTFAVSTQELAAQIAVLSTDNESKQEEIDRLKFQLQDVEIQRDQYRAQLQQLHASGHASSAPSSKLSSKAQQILTLIDAGDLAEELESVFLAVQDTIRAGEENAAAAAAREAQAERVDFDRQPTIDSVFDSLHELPAELQSVVDCAVPDTRFDEDIISVRAKLQSLQTEEEAAEQGPLGLQPELAAPIERAKEALEQGGGDRRRDDRRRRIAALPRARGPLAAALRRHAHRADSRAPREVARGERK